MRNPAFEYYLRTSRRPDVAALPDEDEVKFNPYHDALGRFTFAGGAVAAMGRAPAGGAAARSRAAVSAARPAAQSPPTPPRGKAVAEVPGFSESGRTSWRSSNDATFAAAADFYNRKYGLKPGDPDYKTPEFLKAWAMRESGGEGDRAAFATDPFQVNKHGDWDPKKAALGLRQDQAMTPAVSAYAALEWLRQKSFLRDGKGGVRYLGTQRALERYNGNNVRTRQSGNEIHSTWYARTIMQMARAASAKGQ